MADGVANHDRIVADAAHAVRGPFGAALPALGMVVDGLLGEVSATQLEALRTVERALGRAALLATDLVVLAGAALPAARSGLTSCAVPALLARAAELCRKSGVAAPRPELEADLPCVLVHEELCAAVLCVLLGRTAGKERADTCGAPEGARVVATVLPHDDHGGAGGRSRPEADPDAAAVPTAGPMVVLQIGAAVDDAGWGWQAEDDRDAALILCRGVVETGGGRLLTGGGRRLPGGAASPCFRLDLPAQHRGTR